MSKSKWAETRKQHGKPCAYCARERDTESDQLRPTRDHVVPKSKLRLHQSEIRIVWACYVCNAIKSDKEPEEWDAYMKNHPEWWKGSGHRSKPGHDRNRYRAAYPINQPQPDIE